MSATLSQIRLGIKGQLATLTTLNTYDKDQDVLTPPFAVVTLEGGANAMFADYTQSFDGLTTWTFTVRVAVANATTPGAETALDPYLDQSSATSIKAIIEADSSLGGLAGVNAIVKGARAYGIFVVNGASYLGAEFIVEVYS